MTAKADARAADRLLEAAVRASVDELRGENDRCRALAVLTTAGEAAALLLDRTVSS